MTTESIIKARAAVEKRMYDLYISKHKCENCIHKGKDSFCHRIFMHVADDFHCMMWEDAE